MKYTVIQNQTVLLLLPDHLNFHLTINRASIAARTASTVTEFELYIHELNMGKNEGTKPRPQVHCPCHVMQSSTGDCENFQ